MIAPMLWPKRAVVIEPLSVARRASDTSPTNVAGSLTNGSAMRVSRPGYWTICTSVSWPNSSLQGR